MSTYTESEKQRIDYVVQLEAHIKNQAEDLLHYRALADRWAPKLTHSVTETTVQVTLMIDGKAVTATVPKPVFYANSENDITVSVVDTLLESLVAERIRPLVAEQIVALQKELVAERNVGQWVK
jgi:hypothetical protein